MVIKNNFLNKKDFKKIKDLTWSPNFPYYFQNLVNYNHTNEDGYSYFTHTLFVDGKVNSKLYDVFLPLINKLKIKKLIRVKVNCYPRTSKLEIHKSHVDYSFTHKGFLYSINTCDGKTILYDNTKIDSVENRALFFDSSKPHRSTSTTNAKVRLNVNINYI